MKVKLALLATLVAMVSLVAVPTMAQALTPSLSLGKVKLNKKKGTAKLTVTVNQKGKLKLTCKGVKTVNRTAATLGKYVLPVKPKGKTKTKLNNTGKAKVKCKVTFTITPPDNYTPSSTSKSKRIKLKKS
jgi:hypothetical protein